MKKLLCLLIAALLLTSVSLAETYTEVTKHYLNTHGQCWNYDQELWLAYVTDVKASDTSRSNTGRAIAATEYILPPADALSTEEAAIIAISAANPDAQARPLVPCFLLDGRAVYKVILYVPNSEDPIAATVELDAYTGEVLGVYPYILEEFGYFFVPNAVWKAVTLAYTPEELAQMTWSQLFDAYLARHGHWKDWNAVRWDAFVTAVRQADVGNSRTGRAVATTEYIMKPPLAMFEEEAAERACAAVSKDAYADNLVLCCQLDGVTLYKVTVHAADTVYSVELDAMTGDILGIYPQTSEGVGQFLVPHAIWEAIPATAPNG